MKWAEIAFNPVFLGPILVFFFGWFFYYFWRARKTALLQKSLNFSLYEVSFPRGELKKEEGEKRPAFGVAASSMEQFYTGMMEVKPCFSLEIVSPATERETNFYVAIPREFFPHFEKQVHFAFPGAEIREEKTDYNIFKYKSPAMGAIALLEKNDILPIKTYDEMAGNNPIEAVANSFSTLLREKEGAAMQIIVSTAKNHFAGNVKSAIKMIESDRPLEDAIGSRGKSFAKDLGRAVTGRSIHARPRPLEETAKGEIIEALKKKIAKPIVSVNIRLVASAEDGKRVLNILKEVKSALGQFSNPHGNNFIIFDTGGLTLKKLFYNFSFRTFNPVREVNLNLAELSSLFHFPAYSVSAPKVKKLALRKAQPPAKLPEEGVILGYNNFRGGDVEIRLAPDDRRKHLYVIGQTGTGKSSMLKDMIYQDIVNGKGVCFIDPHGEDVESILGQIPAKRWDDVVYFNPADIKRPLGLNMLEYDPNFPEQKTFIVNELLEIFSKLYDMSTAGGPMFEQYFRNATMLVMDDPESGNTLLEISRVLSDANFRKRKLLKCTNPVVRSFWIDAAEKAGGEASLQNMVPYITSKFDAFLSNDIMRPIIAQEKSSFNFRQIMDNNKIFLVNLSKGRLGDTNAHLLGMILVGRIFMSAMSRGDIPEAQRSDFYLYLDEFQNITTNTISMILSEARKYRLNLTVAHQFIGQLQEEIKKSVFGNVGSMAVFRVGMEDAGLVAKQFEPVFSADDLANIPNFNAYLKLLINGETTLPFNIEISKPRPSDKGVAEKVKETSAIKYGRPISEIENEISKRYAKGVSREQVGEN